jgi:F0F1-type ATP synthase assembly protein I
MPLNQRRKGNRETPLDYRKLAGISSLAMALPSGIAVGLFLGYFLDKWLGTEPWMLIVWTLLGVASGLISLLRGIAKYGRDSGEDG